MTYSQASLLSGGSQEAARIPRASPERKNPRRYGGLACAPNRALSNPQVAATLDGLVGRRRNIDLAVAADLSDRSVRLPQGAIQAAVLEVLRLSSGSLRVAEIHGRVEEELGRVVSRDTIASFLSVACGADGQVVLRVERGVYTVARPRTAVGKS